MSAIAKKHTPLTVLLMGLLILNTIGVVAPLLVALISSFKSTAEIMNNPFGLPQSLSLANFEKVLGEGNFGVYFRNSVLVTAGSEAIILSLSAMAGYALGRYRFRLNGVLYTLILMGLMIPAKLLLVPLFLQLKQMGLLDSLWGLILVYAAGGIPAGVFIMTSFFWMRASSNSSPWRCTTTAICASRCSTSNRRAHNCRSNAPTSCPPSMRVSPCSPPAVA